MSVSTYDARRKVWRQTWVDNQAGYLDFEGGRFDGPAPQLVLSRSAVINGQPVRQRMVFRDIGAKDTGRGRAPAELRTTD